MSQQTCVRRTPWTLEFVAEPEELAALRRITGLHLRYWGLHHMIDAAQLCVTELVTNVIRHVGPGTPAELSMGMSGTSVRIEVQDPDLRVLPTLVHATEESETGRGMAIVDAVATRWGVLIQSPERKVTWCELATGLKRTGGHINDDRVSRVEALLGLYAQEAVPRVNGAGLLCSGQHDDLASKTALVGLITDLLRWARAHGHDEDELLARAEARIYAE